MIAVKIIETAEAVRKLFKMTSKDPGKDGSSLKLSEANNYLGFNLYKLLSSEKGNVFFSPFSLSSAFAMLFYATKNETSKEFRNVLGYEKTNIEDSELKSAYQKLLNEIENSSDSYTLTAANSVVSQNNFPFSEEYKSLLNDFFKACLWEVDFTGDTSESIQLINEWVSGKTQKMIPNLLQQLNPMTVMVLLNAVYFKGFWKNPFDKKDTRSEKFNIRGEKDNYKNVEMMHIEEHFLFTQNELCKVLELPYQGEEISMLILLPNENKSTKHLESILRHDSIQALKKCMYMETVNVAIPKFKIDFSKSLKNMFERLGLKRLFSSNAQLDGLTGGPNGLFVSDVIHQAVIEVNEEGSEASAATAGLFDRCLPPQFIADRPFMFIIYNTKSSMILFIGRVEEL